MVSNFGQFFYYCFHFVTIEGNSWFFKINRQTVKERSHLKIKALIIYHEPRVFDGRSLLNFGNLLTFPHLRHKVWVLFLLFPKELVPFVILTQRCYLKTADGQDSLSGMELWSLTREYSESSLESQLLEEPLVLARLVLLLELGPDHVAGLLLLHGILKQVRNITKFLLFKLKKNVAKSKP